MDTWKVFRRSSGVFRLTSEVFQKSSLLSTVSTWANDAVLQTIKLCSVDHLSSYRCEVDEIQDKNKLSRAPFILFGVGVATRKVFRGSSNGLAIASDMLPNVNVNVNWGWFSLSPSGQRPQTGPFAIPRIYP